MRQLVPCIDIGTTSRLHRLRRGGSTFIVFQQADGYVPPAWPPVEGQQRTMMHFDFQVGDLDSAVTDAVALGATLAEDQPQENVRVMLDPARHPFCLCREVED